MFFFTLFYFHVSFVVVKYVNGFFFFSNKLPISCTNSHFFSSLSPVLENCYYNKTTLTKNDNSKAKHNKDPRNFTQLIKITGRNDDNLVLYFHNNHVSDTLENKHVAGQSKKKDKTVWFVDHASPVFEAVVAKNNRLGHKASATTNLANNLTQQENKNT